MRSDLTDEDRCFSQRLEARRILARISRQRLALAAKLSEATIKHIEKGRTKPSLRSLHSLLTVPTLGLTIDDIPHTLRDAVEQLLALQPSCIDSVTAPAAVLDHGIRNHSAAQNRYRRSKQTQ